MSDRDGPDDPGAPVFASGDRSAFLRVLREIARRHWNSDCRHHAAALLALNEPRAGAAVVTKTP